ncbi:hypothetical protein D1159_03795 [Pseudoflavonifractor sp. 524-17]|uniref:hypothetical protein n=1 Tax=Pseudoflavonifractor sp. 524-17 TaxID=2304577 RepID=UPI00137A8D78|nr:hypothetical protein [Pseudoflavonifractor sp. 524-17]NCE63722.1 hypothetical protein [Pseudoflavonifractor sp. 524-17]
MIRGKYVGTITIEFCVDENTNGLLPFDCLQASVKEELSGVIKKIIEEEVSDIGTVTVEQQFADLYICNEA